MLKAIRQSDNEKVIGYEISKNSDEHYYCEQCNEEVIHHKSSSQVRIGHFKHKPSNYCPNSLPESIEHIKTKKGIYDYLKKTHNSLKSIELEKWICNNSIRPDVYLETKKGAKIAIEVQASQLTIDQMISRTEKYFKHDIYVLWVLVWNKSKISKSHYVLNECNWRTDCFTQNGYHCDHSVKLTEMELFLHWMNFKKLIYWDIENEYGNEFYLVTFEKFVGEESEFYSSGGEYQSFGGRVAKNKKLIMDIQFDFSFSELRPSFVKEYPLPYKNYSLPNRRQLSPPKTQ